MNNITITEIVRCYKEEFFKKYGSKIHSVQLKALNDIINCRTVYFGGKIMECDSCKEKFL